MKCYDYIVVGAGIAGCSTAYFLQKEGCSVLVVDKLEETSQNASSTAGGFLSPLLGKPNPFKDLVTDALTFSIDFYTTHFPELLIHKGVLRIPKDEADEKKFESYIPHIPFEYELKEKGCFFPIGGQIKTYDLCKKLIEKCDKTFNYNIKHINFNEDIYTLNSELQCKNLILTTGADVTLIEEQYFNIRPVWGQRIEIETSSCIDINYHKACSLSTTSPTQKDGVFTASIGATHHRFNRTLEEQKACLDNPSLENFKSLSSDENIIKNNTEILIQRAQDITELKEINVLKERIGARASSVDYFPMVGPLIDSGKTLSMFPHIQKGTHVRSERFERYKNLYVLNGLGGRGFVLGPYLAHNLIQYLLNKGTLEPHSTTDRLFIRWAKRKD